VKFSIVVLTYNRSDLLPRAINSALSQDYNNFEILVINDSSTDNTVEVLAEYSEKIKAFHHSENKGVNGARNTGLDNASGDYLIFLDDDDELLPSALKTFSEAINGLDAENREKIAVIKAHSLNAESSKTTGRMGFSRAVLYYEDIVSGSSISGDFSSCINLELVRGTNFPEYVRGCEDIFWWNIAKKYPFLYINKPVKRMYYQIDGLSHSMFSNADSWAIGYAVMLSDHEQILRDKLPDQYVRRINICMLYFILAGKNFICRRYFKKYKKEIKPFRSPVFIFLYLLSFLPKEITIFLFSQKVNVGLLIKRYRKQHALIVNKK
jgi:GalNAc5-diNAcBac-PP-undecaprenol beta-1,3-glucosyltransferase